MITIQGMGMAKIQDLQPHDSSLDLIRLRETVIPSTLSLIELIEA